jgi:serine/threonine protein kinase
VVGVALGRDLSLENIVLSQDDSCRIVDFGMALVAPVGAAGDSILLTPQPPQGKWTYVCEWAGHAKCML